MKNDINSNNSKHPFRTHSMYPLRRPEPTGYIPEKKQGRNRQAENNSFRDMLRGMEYW